MSRPSTWPKRLRQAAWRPFACWTSCCFSWWSVKPPTPNSLFIYIYFYFFYLQFVDHPMLLKTFRWVLSIKVLVCHQSVCISPFPSRPRSQWMWCLASMTPPTTHCLSSLCIAVCSPCPLSTPHCSWHLTPTRPLSTEWSEEQHTHAHTFNFGKANASSCGSSMQDGGRKH